MKKFLFLFAFLFTSVISFCQVRQKINAYGYDWNRGGFDISVRLPPDTAALTNTEEDIGSIAYKDGGIYKWNGIVWSVLSGQGVDSVTVVNDSTFRIYSAGSYFETVVPGISVASVAQIARDSLLAGTGININHASGVISSTITQADGSETKINPGQNVLSITGLGTNASPYTINVKFSVDSVTQSNDSLFTWSGGVRSFRYKSGGGNTNSNIGSGYRLAVPGTNNIKTLHAGVWTAIDSTSNANELTVNSDSTAVVARMIQIAESYGGGVDTTIIAGQGLVKLNTTLSVDFMRSKKVATLGISALNSFGDSYTEYSSLAYLGRSWVQILSSRLGMSLNNYASSGHGIYYASAQANTNVVPGSNSAMTVILAGLNDLRRGGNIINTLNKIKYGYYSVIFNSLIDTIYYGNSSSITKTGTWTSQSFASLGGKSGNFGTNGTYSKTIGDTLTTQLSGDAIGIGFIGADGTNRTAGTIKVIVDNNIVVNSFSINNLTDGENDGSNDNTAQPGVLFIKGLGKSFHTIKVVVTSADTIRIDYIANAKPSTTVAPIVIGQLPRLTVGGYAVPPANANDAVMNSGDSTIALVIQDFVDYPITLAFTNSYWNTTQLRDNVHPDSIGHYGIFSGFMEKIITPVAPASSISVAGSNGDIQYNSSGNLGAESDFNYNSSTNVLQVNGQIAAGGSAFASDWLLSAHKIGAVTTIGLYNSDNNSNHNLSYFIKSKAGNYNLGAGVKIGELSFNTVSTFGVISNAIVNGGFSEGDFYWNAGSDIMKLSNIGSLGIGSYGTTDRLSVKATGLPTKISLKNNDLINYNEVYFEKTIGASYNINVGDTVGRISFNTFSGIQAVANTNTDGSYRNNDITFWTSPSLSTAEAMRLTSEGKLGIGTSSPDSLLHIDGSLHTIGGVRHDNLPDGSGSDSVLVTNNGTVKKVLQSSIGAATTIYNGDGTLSGNRTVTMSGNTLNFTGGNIGFGVTSPSAGVHLKASGGTAGTTPLKYTSGPLVSAAEAGTHEYNDSHYETKASGLRYATGGVIADFYTDANNSGTSETDLYSYTTPASTLARDGDKLTFSYVLNLNDATATSQIKVQFAGTAIANTGAITISSAGVATITGWIIRTGSSTARGSVTVSTGLSASPISTSETDLTGLTFTNTNILKVTGQAGGAGGSSSDITGKMGMISWWGAANN